MKSKESLIENIVIAMEISGVHQLTEGEIYWTLFKQEIKADAATAAVKYAIDENILIRNGHVLILNHGKKNSPWPRAVCNS